MEFGIMLRLVGVMNLILIRSGPFSIQRREPYLSDFIKKTTFSIDLYSDIYRLISLIVETTKLYISVSVWMTLTFIQGHSCMRNEKLWHPFSSKFIDLDEIQCVGTTCWFVEAHAKFILHKY